MKIIYSKRGHLIEFNQSAKLIYLKSLKRGLSFLFDILLTGVIQIILVIIFGINVQIIILSSLVSLILNAVIFILLPLLIKKTPGMIFSKMFITHKTGFMTRNRDHIKRGFLGVLFFSPPLIREVSMITSIIFAFITKGFTPIDLLSGTICVSEKTYLELQKTEINDSFSTNDLRKEKNGI